MSIAIRRILNEIKELLQYGKRDEKALPVNEFKRYLDPEDDFYKQIVGKGK